MEIELELTPDMFYYDFDFYNGLIDLDFSYEYKKEYTINIWGIDISIFNEKIKEQLSEDIIEKLKVEGKYDRIFINGISKLYFYDVIEINFNLEMLENKSVKRIHDINNNEVVLKYKRGEKKEEFDLKTFKFPDASIYFPNSWMEGYITSRKNAKLVINLEHAILVTDYIKNAKNIYSEFRKKYDFLG